MRVLFFLRYSRDQASSRVRGFYMAEELKKKRIDCATIYGSGKNVYLRFLLNLMRYDIIYFQKRYSEIDLKLNKLARLMGKKTIFDIDDAPSGVSVNQEVKKHAIEMMKSSSAVIVGSHKLLDFSKKFNRFAYLIPSPVNLNYYKPKREKRNRNYITIGWIGNGIVYKKDLLMLIKPIEKIGEKYKIKFVIIGALGQKEIHQCLSKIKNVTVEIIDSIDWANPIAAPSVISDFDIGLYPLLNNEYNQYKCGFKALEYMAMGVPVVASPVGENKFIIESGKNGFLASNEREWGKYLSCLIEDEYVRKKMGGSGRKKIEENYSIAICAKKLIKNFEDIERKK